MHQNQDSRTTGQVPGAVGVSVQHVDGPAKYETGKGCLMFVLIGLVGLAITVAVIVMLSDPTAVV